MGSGPPPTQGGRREPEPALVAESVPLRGQEEGLSDIPPASLSKLTNQKRTLVSQGYRVRVGHRKARDVLLSPSCHVEGNIQDSETVSPVPPQNPTILTSQEAE